MPAVGPGVDRLGTKVRIASNACDVLRGTLCARPGSGQQLVEPALRVILHARDDVGEIRKVVWCR